MSVEVIERSVFQAVDEVNRLAPAEKQLKKEAATVLFGPESLLDSMGLANFIVSVEQNLMENGGFRVVLISEESMASTENPFATIGNLIRYLTKSLKKE